MKTRENNSPRLSDRMDDPFHAPTDSRLDVLLYNPRRPHKREGKDIKKAYMLTLMAGLVISLGGFTLLMRADLSNSDNGQDFQLTTQERVQMEEIEQTRQEMKAPPPPRPPIPVEVPDDVVMEDIELDLDVTLELDAEILDIPPPPPTPAAREEEEEPEIFVVVEQMPTIIGGTERLYSVLNYPEIARQAGIEGMVVIQVVVMPDGSPSQPFVARSGGEILDKAAVEAVMKLSFSPGKQRGKPVMVRMAIPIRFRLKEASR